MKLINFTLLKWSFGLIFFLCMLKSNATVGNPDEVQEMKFLDAIEEISKNFDVYFSFDRELVKDLTVHYEVDHTKSLEEVVIAILKGTNLQYKLFDERFVIIYKKDLEGIRSIRKMVRHMEEIAAEDEKTLLQPTPKLRLRKFHDNSYKELKGLEVHIQGVVTDNQGNPLIGVNVQIKGTSKGTATDIEGAFKLQDVDEDATLVFSYIGYQTVEVSVDGRSRIEVTMLSDSQLLDEVVVVAYNEQSKDSYTGSADPIDMKDIQGAPRVSFQESLQGNAVGVQSVSPSGQPGGELNVRIRGIGSISAKSSPLYVIDGIPVVTGDISRLAESSNMLAGINPNDIESITVLKDASATAIYGSRGANGVILITTKKGQSGRTKFDVNIQRGMSNVLLEDRNKPLRTPELSELLVESRINNGDTPQEAEEYVYSRIDRNIDTDWFDVVTRPGKYEQYYLSASGGSDKTYFYSSMGYYNQESTVIGIDYEKLNAKFNVNHAATDRLNLDLGISASSQTLHTNSDAGAAANPVRAMFREVPWEPVFNEDGSYNTDILLTYNPVGLVEENIRETKLYNVLGNLGLQYQFSDHFSFESKGNIDFNLADEFQYDNPYFGAARNDGGRGRAYDKIILNWNVTNLLRYQWEVNTRHDINFILGQEAQKIQTNFTYAYASNYGAPGLTTLANASLYQDASSEKTASSINSYFLSIDYSLLDKYYINLAGRRDGSSRFGTNVRFANFGSVGLGWNIHREPYMDELGYVNELRLRTSYGINGNEGIGDFDSRGLYATGADYDENPGYTYNQQANPNLTWEKSKPFNIGLDFRIFDRLSGTVEYYNRLTTDLILDVPISGTNGITSYKANIGEMSNKGWELSLSSIIIDQPEGFSWYTDLNYSTNENEILKLRNEEPIINTSFQQIRRVGSDFYTFYLPGYAGVNPENGEALWYTDGTKSETTNDYGAADPYEHGSALPDFYGGLTNTLSYRDISLSFMFFINWGNQVYDYWARYVNSDGSARLNDRGNMSRKIYERRWQQPGDITDVPKVVWGNTQSGRSNQHSTRFLYDGSYIRLRDVTLSYNMPTNLLSKIKVANARIYLRGNNVWTWVKDTNMEMDPEVGLAGKADLRVPTSRQFLVGIDFSF